MPSDRDFFRSDRDFFRSDRDFLAPELSLLDALPLTGDLPLREDLLSPEPLSPPSGFFAPADFFLLAPLSPVEPSFPAVDDPTDFGFTFDDSDLSPEEGFLPATRGSNSGSTSTLGSSSGFLPLSDFFLLLSMEPEREALSGIFLSLSFSPGMVRTRIPAFSRAEQKISPCFPGR